jgi:phospholipid/cholesterol/gamma-HCH transport system substrate-binding protein
MQIKLTPVSEGGLLPTSLEDLVTLCRSTPLAPICSSVGDPIAEFCALLPGLLLCDQTGNAALAPDVAQPDSTSPDTTTPGAPDLPDILKPPTTPDAGGGGSGGSFVDKLFGGLLGGGGR